MQLPRLEKTRDEVLVYNVTSFAGILPRPVSGHGSQLRTNYIASHPGAHPKANPRPVAIGRLAHGIPAASFVLLALAGCSFVIGMTGLKTLESLTEGAQR